MDEKERPEAQVKNSRMLLKREGASHSIWINPKNGTIEAVPFGALQKKALDTINGTIYLGERDLTVGKTSVYILSIIDKLDPNASTAVKSISKGAGWLNIGSLTYDFYKAYIFEADKVEIGVERLVGLSGTDKDFVVFSSKYAEKRMDELIRSGKVIIEDINNNTGSAGTIMYDSDEINKLKEEIQIMGSNWENFKKRNSEK